jgi:hypothetical protein
MEGGTERLKAVNYYRPGNELQEYSGTLEKYFTENPPHSISKAVAKIKELTGVWNVMKHRCKNFLNR